MIRSRFSQVQTTKRSLRRSWEEDCTFGERIHGLSQRCYFWFLRFRSLLFSAFWLAWFYGWWGSSIAQFKSVESIAAIAVWISLAMAGVSIAHLISGGVIATNRITPLAPLPDRCVWLEFYVSTLKPLLFIIPGLVICYAFLVSFWQVPAPVKLWMAVVGVLSHTLLSRLAAELLMRFRWVHEYAGWGQITIGMGIGVATVGLYRDTFDKIVGTLAFDLLWFLPPAWPALLFAKQLPGIPPVASCLLLTIASAALLAFLVWSLDRNSRSYHITDVMPWENYYYAYGYSPLTNSAADVASYDAWADSLLQPKTDRYVVDNSSGEVPTDDELPTADKAAEEESFEGFGENEHLDSWLAEEHRIAEQQWDEAFEAFPLRLLSQQDQDIVRVRCVEAHNLFRFRWKETLWRCVVLAAALALLPDAASLLAGVGLGWVLFGSTFSAIFQTGIVRAHELPYRIEHVIAAEVKYRLLAISPLLLPIAIATFILGIRNGLAPTQCIDLALRLFALAICAAVAGVFVILFGRVENRWQQWRFLFVLPLFLIAIAVTASAAIFSLTEFGLPAWCACAVTISGLAVCYRLSLFWFYHCKVDLAANPTA